MNPTLEAAIEAAVAAGAVLRRKWPQTRQVKSKGMRDIVTDADYAAQHAIAGRLQSRFPEYAFLGEEGPAAVDFTGPTPTWVVDPLDGTTNYARRVPCFSVAVALVQAGQVEVGVIHDPLRRETFYAARGQGAFVQAGRGRPQPLHASATSRLDDFIVGVDWAREPGLRQRSLEAHQRVATLCRTVRCFGSAALGLAYVATGWLDGYFHLALMPWDVAASALLIAEAGGCLTAPDGGAWRLGNGQLVASNARAHGRLVEVLAL